MLVQALAQYADTYLAEALNDAAWESTPVPWLLEVGTDGAFLGAIPRMTTEKRGKKEVQVAQLLAMPRSPVKRNSGHHPRLAADDIMYVLGPGPWNKPQDAEKATAHFEAFVALIGHAAAKTGSAALEACARFYANPAEVEKARAAFAGAKAGEAVALSVDGPLTRDGTVRQFWREHYAAAFAERVAGNSGECLISGAIGPIAPTHEAIKGASNLGGQQSGVALMSFDKAAFCSYGWEQNQNSPVSPDRALAYVLALNALLRSGNAASSRRGRRIDIAGIGFLTWLQHPDDFDALDLMENADPDQVKRLLELDPAANPDENRFRLLGVSGNGGRLRVRYWVDESLPVLKRNLRDWHEQLRLHYPWDAPPVRFWQLKFAIDREGEPASHYVLALLRRGLEGRAQPLGYPMLAAALGGLRHPPEPPRGAASADQDPYSVARLRIPLGLVRLCVNDLRRLKGDPEMTEGLDPSCRNAAYVCGRLMAVFEQLQRESAGGELNVSVLDRYLALASTYPAAAFPKVELLAAKHLRKLRRERPGAANAIDTRLGELHGLLEPANDGAFPKKLGLEGQGLFMLGYYHQKAASIAQATERKLANQAAEKTEEIKHERD